MIKLDEQSNAQSWELEITCKSKEYLDKIVKAILKCGNIEFEVNLVEGSFNHEGVWVGKYTVLMWCNWFNNLSQISNDLRKIEKKLDNL